jgi:tripartite-type tricarboxylate transporter receptor subunit TctC
MLRTLSRALLALSLAVMPFAAVAQDAWPSKPIRIVVPFPAGGQLDVVVRLVADRLAPALGQSIVVENRTGADGSIAAEFVKNSPPDGYTWLATSVPFATSIALHPKSLRYDPVQDFQPIANLGTSSFVLVVPTDVPAKTVQEFVAYAKARPGKLSYGGTSVGSVTHLSTEMFMRATGLEMEMIPYAGIPPALSDLVTGRTQFMSLGLIAAQPQIKAGKLRPLAVLDRERNKLLPDTPSIAEAGFADLAVNTWFGLFVPAQTPKDVVTRIHAEVMKALAQPEVLAKYQSIGVDPVTAQSTDAFGEQFRSEIAKWGKVVTDAKIKTD